MQLKYLFLLSFILALGQFAQAQTHPDYTLTHKCETTSVKDQGKTGTCWAYTAISFIESEALRKGKAELDLSEMYIVKHVYPTKASYYIRLHGKGNFSQGGQAHDVTNAAKKVGLVPESVFSGMPEGMKEHNHTNLMKTLKSVADQAAGNADFVGDPMLYINAVLDAHFGKSPETFDYNGKTYSPKSFAREVAAFNPDDYIELSSFSHHPYYQKFDLEVPDNWSHDDYYNLPINDLMQVMTHALKNGYSVAWDGDISEEGFDHLAGKAHLSASDKGLIRREGLEKARQITFMNFGTTDDHLMHITGLAEDKKGSIYFQTKNSWADNSNKYGGYLFMSEKFVQLKTIAFMIHKDALPDVIAKKLGIK